jgi:hypothetical protein
MARAILVLGVVLILALAGCLDEVGSSSKTAKARALAAKSAASSLGKLTPVTTPLWNNPETFPHPAYNYPTLSNPPQGTIGNPWLRPIAPGPMPATIAGLNHVAQDQGTTSGAGMSLIRDPTRPTVVGMSPERSRGSDTIVYPSGRILAVVATGGPRIGLIDITDPTHPVDLTAIEASRTHKVDVVPGTPIIYNSAGREIYDVTNPEAPVKAEAQMPAACHRTYFYIQPAENYYRAICAGYDTTQLWDIKDPLRPTVVISIPMWHGNPALPPTTKAPATFSHFAILSQNHHVLVVGDEMGGGGAPACGLNVAAPGRDVSTPLGALWFYDVTNEKSPVFKGWLAVRTPIPENQAAFSCTAHHGRLVPDPQGKRDLLAMAWYAAGVVLVDFTDPSAARVVDQFNTGAGTWEAWYYNGYIFTGDARRGLDAIGFR